ncbi:MAG: hypothetical protein AMXMBFR13_42770 [Phycisphaerae bacterium]
MKTREGSPDAAHEVATRRYRLLRFLLLPVMAASVMGGSCPLSDSPRTDAVVILGGEGFIPLEGTIVSPPDLDLPLGGGSPGGSSGIAPAPAFPAIGPGR